MEKTSRFRPCSWKLLIFLLCLVIVVLSYLYAAGSKIFDSRLPLSYWSGSSPHLIANSQWRLQEGLSYFYIYRAYEDLREGKFRTRIFTVRHKEVAHLCVFWGDFRGGFLRQTKPVTSRVPAGAGWSSNGLEYKEEIVTCELPRSFTATHVALTKKDNEEVIGRYAVHILNAHARTKQKWTWRSDRTPTISVCVKTTWGWVNPYYLIQWFELQILLGISHVHMYLYQKLLPDTIRVLRHYENRGLLSITQIFRDNVDPKVIVKELTEAAALNDCLYRNLNKVDRLIVLDLDELILPRIHDSYVDLVRHIEKLYSTNQQPASSYELRNQYHFTELAEDESQPLQIPSLRYRKHVNLSKEGYSGKSFIEHEVCLCLQNHLCWRLLPSYKDLYKIFVDVSPEIARLHHYKSCHFGHAKCKLMMSSYTSDDVILKWKADLVARMVVTVEELNWSSAPLMDREQETTTVSDSSTNTRTLVEPIAP